MKQLVMKALVVVCIGLLGVLSFAQDDTTGTFEFEESGASVTFPDDWEQSFGEDGAFQLAIEGVGLFLYDAIGVENLLDGEDVESPEALLELMEEAFPIDAVIGDDIDVELGAIKTVDLDGRDVARLPFELEQATGAFIALPMDDGTLGLAMFMIFSDVSEEASPIVDEIIASFNVAVDDDSPASDEACTVSTTQSNTVEIRVGPGANRTVIAFLPVGLSFDVLGQTTDSEDNIWFSVPKEDVAPTKAVNETWVAGGSVDQRGDCANVVDALAPPIIPIRQAQSTPVPQVATDGTVTEPTTTTTEADTGDAFAVDSSCAFIPTQGQWLETRNNGNVRCGSESSEASPVQGTIIGQLSGGGSNGIVFAGSSYTYIGNNTYESYYTEQTPYGDFLLRESFTLTSANTGEGSVGGVLDACTFFLPITVNYMGG